jgi:hypothetical protein
VTLKNLMTGARHSEATAACSSAFVFLVQLNLELGILNATWDEQELIPTELIFAYRPHRLPKTTPLLLGNGRFFARMRSAASPPQAKDHLARNMLYLKRVLIMNYAQFHTLYGALKERVGSVKKLRTR